VLTVLRSVAQLIVHRGEQPAVLVVQPRPRRSRHTSTVPAGAALSSTEWIAKTSDPAAMKETPTPLPSVRL
jgi:hypothetical protein